jgi:hypothetical protein
MYLQKVISRKLTKGCQPHIEMRLSCISYTTGGSCSKTTSDIQKVVERTTAHRCHKHNKKAAKMSHQLYKDIVLR